jgi:hypothetical protein
LQGECRLHLSKAQVKLGFAFGSHAISDDINSPEPTAPTDSPAMRSKQRRTESRNLSVVSDICKANAGCGSELFAYPRKKSLKQAWFCIRFARHLDQSPFSAAAQHSSNKFDFAFALHENPDDINSPEIQGK